MLCKKENTGRWMKTEIYAHFSKAGGFYKSKEWRRVRKLALQRDHYLCQDCLKEKRFTKATEVHHIRALTEHPELALNLNNLRCLCWVCHERTKKRTKITPPHVRVVRVTDDG